MENSSIYDSLKNLIAVILLGMSPLLRGRSNTRIPSEKPLGLSEFINGCKKIPTSEDKNKFHEAFKAQLNNDFSFAIKLYKDLEKIYKSNKAIKYNLKLMNN